jgi:hypothetical protein
MMNDSETQPPHNLAWLTESVALDKKQALCQKPALVAIMRGGG